MKVIVRRLIYCHLFDFNTRKTFASMGCLILLTFTTALAQAPATGTDSVPRQRISINENWRLVIIRTKTGDSGSITITAKSPGLKETQVVVKSR